MSKSDKIPKIIARLQQKIEEGQFYEAQQQTRVVAARYTKAANWDAAIDILYNVAQSLLRAGQGGSGGDLSILMVDAYDKAELKVDAAAKGRLLTLLRLFDSEEPTRKKFITEMISWSARFGEYPAGDPELHHIAGTLYAEEHDPYDAERHLVLGTKDSPAVLARLEYAWYTEDDPHTAPVYAARAVLPYLLVGNVRAAAAAHALFCAALAGPADGARAPAASEDVATAASDARVFPGLPLLNFLTLLLLAVPRGAPDVFRQLCARYAPHLREAEGFGEALDMIGEMYFGIARPRQSNPLFDMLGGMFGGGAPGGAAAPKKGGLRRVEAAPPSEGLD